MATDFENLPAGGPGAEAALEPAATGSPEEITQFNEQARLANQERANALKAEDAPEPPAAGGEPEPKPVEEPKKEEPAKEPDKKPDEGDEPADKDEGDQGDESQGDDEGAGEAEPFKFTENTDTATRADELTSWSEQIDWTGADEAKQAFDLAISEIKKFATVQDQLEAYGGVEKVVGSIQARDMVFDTREDPKREGRYIPNAEPLVRDLMAGMPNEIGYVARELGLQPSVRYPGATLFQEALIEEYGANGTKLDNIMKYLEADISLPVIATGMPDGVPIEVRDAWASDVVSEQKRFKIESLSKAIGKLKGDITNAHGEAKSDLETELRGLESELEDDVKMLRGVQSGIETDRATKAREAAQVEQNRQLFRDHVNTKYNEKVFEMSSAAEKDVADTLTFLDERMRPSFARNILTRIMDALETDTDGQITPTAQFHAQKLKEEGIDYNFVEGAAIMHKFYKATEKLESLQITPGVSKEALDKAQRKYNGLIKDIKVEQTDLIGRISGSYVKSAGTQLTTEVDKAKTKKQLSLRGIATGGKPAGEKPQPKGDDAEIREYNANVAKRLATGEDLYEFHQG